MGDNNIIVPCDVYMCVHMCTSLREEDIVDIISVLAMVTFIMGFPVKVVNPPAMRETWIQSLGWEDPLEESMATDSSILAWRIPMDRGA